VAHDISGGYKLNEWTREICYIKALLETQCPQSARNPQGCGGLFPVMLFYFVRGMVFEK
jgi:hypothetical protein